MFSFFYFLFYINFFSKNLNLKCDTLLIQFIGNVSPNPHDGFPYQITSKCSRKPNKQSHLKTLTIMTSIKISFVSHNVHTTNEFNSHQHRTIREYRWLWHSLPDESRSHSWQWHHDRFLPPIQESSMLDFCYFIKKKRLHRHQNLICVLLPKKKVNNGVNGGCVCLYNCV